MPGKRDYKLPKTKYCGAELLPEGKTYGSLDECSLAGQIRLWNAYDMTNQLIKNYENQFTMGKMQMEKIGNNSGATKYAMKLIDIRDKLKELRGQLKDIEKNRKKVLEKLDAEHKDELAKFKVRYNKY